MENKDSHEMKDENKVKAGLARAQALSPEERSAIARKAASARWKSDLIKATHTGDLTIGSNVIPCAVLEDGTRVLWQQGFLRAIGRTGRAMASAIQDESLQLPVFLRAENLKPFIDSDLIEASKPIVFQPIISSRGGISYGYKAELLPRVCSVFIDAAIAGKLKKNQKHIYDRCKILLRSFATVGITALVDEATGYQYIRSQDALQAYLEKLIRKELAAWARRFPQEFYQEMFRLKHWSWTGENTRRPMLAAKYTADVIYSRLGPGVLEKLREVNQKDERGNRKAKHHQWLTSEVGIPELAQHLHATIALMKVNDEWESFMKMLNKVFPKQSPEDLQLKLFAL